jgi:hypothetical protein
MKKRAHITPATVLAGLALFLSLGGVSYGIAARAITSRDIRDNAIRSQDVRNGGLHGRDVANGTLQSRDVRDGALRGVDVNDGSLGGVDLAANTLGDREINEPDLDVQRLGGVDASRYVRNVRRVQTETANDPVTPKSAPPARCPDGTDLLGGGARVVTAAPAPVALSVNAPGGGKAWEASAYATAPTGNWKLVAVAICG